MTLQTILSGFWGKQKPVVTCQTGALVDYRSLEEKSRDYRPEEAFAFASDVSIWKEKSIEEIELNIKATSIKQNATSRCVSEYAGIAMGYAEFFETGKRIDFSRRDVYARRANKPNGGMAMHDLFKIMRDGTCYESQLPSDALTEQEIDRPYTVTDGMIVARKTHAIGDSFQWRDGSYTIDNIAHILSQGTPVCLFWYFSIMNANEWWLPQPTVRVSDLKLFGDDTTRHQATAVDFCLINGEKHIVVMDSAGHGTGLGAKKNLRLISESFFKSRCYSAGFVIDKANLNYYPQTTLAYTFRNVLKIGSSGADVIALQKILVAEGCMNIKSPTGVFAGLTRAGVIKLQEKYAHEILVPVGLKKGTGVVGASTIKFLNMKYKQ